MTRASGANVPAGAGERGPREQLVTRQMLHAALLGFEHPITGQAMTFVAPLREDMGAFVELLRATRFIDRPQLPGAITAV